MTIGHIVITVPYTILVILPRLGQIDASLAEAAYDLGAGPLTTFRRVTLPLILPAVVSAFMIAFTTSFDEYAVASFLVGPRQTFPVFLYSALRFPSQLPQVIAVAVVVLLLTLVVIVAAEVWRRRAEARLEAADRGDALMELRRRWKDLSDTAHAPDDSAARRRARRVLAGLSGGVTTTDPDYLKIINQYRLARSGRP